MDGGSPELFFAKGDRVIEGDLQPQSTTQRVVPAFYGGPWDGLVDEKPIDVSNVLGTVRARHGTYQLSGFRPTNKYDRAVYVWEAKNG
jgi:hypothetical protein